jgi:hypothetical protein
MENWFALRATKTSESIFLFYIINIMFVKHACGDNFELQISGSCLTAKLRIVFRRMDVYVLQ